MSFVFTSSESILKRLFVIFTISFLNFQANLFSQTFNPMDGVGSFHVISEGDFTFGSNSNTHIHGPLAVGGNLILANNFSNPEINMDAGSSTYIFPGDGSIPTGLLVKGAITWPTSGGDVKVQQNTNAHIGSSTGSISSNNSGGGFTQILKTGAAYNATPRIGVQRNMSPSNVFQTVTFDFASLFATLRTRSTQLSGCTNNVALRNPDNGNTPYSTPYNFTTTTKVSITDLVSGTNILNLTQASLNNISEWSFSGSGLPSSTKILVINVNVTADFTWNNPQFSGISQTSAPYVIWNFYGGTTKTITMNQTRLLFGTVYAPNHNFIKSASSLTDIEGSVVAKTVSLNTGEIHIYPFSSTITGCGATCTNPTVSIGGTTDICVGTSTTLTPTVSGGSGYTYNWSTGATTASITVSPATTTTYTLTVTVTGGCSSTATKQVNVSDAKWDNVTVNATCNKLLVDANFASTGNFVVSYTYGGQTYTEPSTGSFSSSSAFELAGQGPGVYSNITIKRASSPECTAVWPQSISVYPSCDEFSCPNNVVVNPSFENGITGWDYSGGNLTTGTYAAVYGFYAGHFRITNASSNWVAQQVPGIFAAGAKIDLSVYAGTHNPSFTHTVGFDYFDTNWNWKGYQSVEVNSQLPTMTKYTLTGTVQSNNGNTPPGDNKYYVTYRAGGDGDWIKTDGWCVVPQVTTCNVSIAGDANVCVGDSVYLTASSSSGTPTSYQWSNGATGVTIRVGPTTNTNYTVTATFSNGCTATATKSITTSTPPSITQCEVRINNSWSVLNNCIAVVNVGSDVALSVNPNTFPAGYTQIWEGPNGFTASGNDAFISSSITPAHEGNYTIIVTNGVCTISQNIYISVNQTSDCSCLSGNLVTNGSFTNQWTGWNGTSYNDAGITSCSDGINKAFLSNGDGAEALLYQDITNGVTANTKFIYSFMAGTHSPSGTHRARVRFYNASGTVLATPLNLEIDKDVDFPANSWCLNLQSYGPYEFTTPANTARIRVEFAEVTTGQGYIKVANVDLKKCNDAPTIALVATNPNCNGQTGSVAFTTAGGTGTKTVRLNGNVVTSPVNNLAAGTYVFTVTDASACSSTKSVTITQPSAINVAVSKVDVLCNGANTGSINLTVSGGTPTYTYVWSNGATTKDISNLLAGTYTVTVTDASGCTKTSSSTITQPASAVSISASGTQPNCFGQTGSINFTTTGGTGTKTVRYNGNVVSSPMTGLAAGSYALIVTDGNGCTSSTSVTINAAPSQILVTPSATNVLCFGANTGSINLTVNGGTPTYTYAWSNGATTKDISNLTAGTYTVTVTDSKGCTLTSSSTITQPASAVSISASGTQPNCFGQTGSISFTTTGGTGTKTVRYNGNVVTSPMTGLAAGSYALIVTDGNGCISSTSVSINAAPSQISITPSATNVLCFGANTGSINLTVGGGTPTYSYAWSNGATTKDISNLTAGTYTVTVTDSKGCTMTSSTSITEPSVLTLSRTRVNVSCFGGNNGSINLTVSGGTSPYTYLWSNGATTEDISGLTSGTYVVTVTDFNSCAKSLSVSISQPSAINTPVDPTNVLCFGESTGSLDLFVSGGTTPYTFAWSNGKTTEDISNLSAGTYTVTITDANGCTKVASGTVTQPSPVIAMAAPTNISCDGQNNGSINLMVSGGTPTYSFAWSNGATTEDLSNLSAGTYTVTVTDANGCTKTASATINQPTAITATTTKVDVDCNGANNGSIDLTVSGGTPT
ncbi:MAG: choice-of-anchor A family protein, partial [Saprospiraceae bacterium]|nr:choice-of-anchor A family protein [Saprospiraceae bacterium]